MISSFKVRPLVSRPSFVALVLITGTSALSTDTYIAALPDVQRSLGTSSSAAQLTMTTCIAGMAIGQLISGPISDARGRRSLVVLATLVFATMSVLCAVAITGWSLIIARGIQGIACGAGTAVGRAVVTDTYAGREAAAKFGTLSAISLTAPVLGPAVGGALLTFGTWRTIFWFLAAVGVAMVLGAVLGLPESLPPQQRHPGGFVQLYARARDLLSDRAFSHPVLVQCMTTGGFFVYIGGSSFVLQQDVGISQHLYTIVFAGNAVAMMLSSIAFRLLVMRFGPATLRRNAMFVQTAAVTGLFTSTVLSPHGRPPLSVIWICLSCMTFGLGMYLPANSSITQLAGRRVAGTASALGGGIPFLVGAFMTPMTGIIGAQTVRAMATAMFVFFALAAITAVRQRLAGRSSTPGPVGRECSPGKDDRVDRRERVW